MGERLPEIGRADSLRAAALDTSSFITRRKKFPRRHARMLCTMAEPDYARESIMDSLSNHTSSSSLPGLALTAWEGTSPAVPSAMTLPAQPFTLWLSPDVWPKSALRLPGNAHTLWQCPDTWPRPRL